jgi:hypothetical protein
MKNIEEVKDTAAVTSIGCSLITITSAISGFFLVGFWWALAGAILGGIGAGYGLAAAMNAQGVKVKKLLLALCIASVAVFLFVKIGYFKN